MRDFTRALVVLMAFPLCAALAYAVWSKRQKPEPICEWCGLPAGNHPHPDVPPLWVDNGGLAGEPVEWTPYLAHLKRGETHP